MASTGDTTLTFDSPELWKSSDPSAEADSPSADPTSPDVAAATSPEGAPTPPAPTPDEGAQVPRDEPGPLPFARHQAILDNERKKREAVEERWGRVAWANELVEQGATKDQVQHALGISQRLTSDPAAFIEQLLTEAAGNQWLSQQVRSIAGRVLGAQAASAQPPAQPAAQDAEPQPDYFTQNEDGSKTPFYSGPQLKKWQEWSQRQTDAKVNERLAPFEAERQQRLEQQQNQQLYQQYYKAGEAQLAELKQQPLFVKHFDAVKAHMEARQFTISPMEAWLHVLHTQVLPSLDQTARASERADLRTQAAASSVNPRAAATSGPATFASFFDIPKDKW